jgi:hypothetical protein
MSKSVLVIDYSQPPPFAQQARPLRWLRSWKHEKNLAACSETVLSTKIGAANVIRGVLSTSDAADRLCQR